MDLVQEMFLQLNHQKLDVFNVAQLFIIECYKITSKFPADEKYSLTTQIRRAALSVFLNINEGASRSSPAERKRFFQISRSSLVEVDAALDIALILGYCKKEDLEKPGALLVRCFAMLSMMINK
jgi:four helix bundle protein